MYRFDTQIRQALSNSRRNEICAWIQQADPSPIHHISKKLYENGTGNWLDRSGEWDDWLAGKFQCIWIHGIPGAGKTIFAAHLIEKIGFECKKKHSYLYLR
ncbi:hypothetical protein F4818DRAFT_423717 [Hypoxylon cercidicola]|nr:hypothetical protein F4818DRAFT_423717 [Hypoxylon cercidicola]